jgi:hypothetical protein
MHLHQYDAQRVLIRFSCSSTGKSTTTHPPRPEQRVPTVRRVGWFSRVLASALLLLAGLVLSPASHSAPIETKSCTETAARSLMREVEADCSTHPSVRVSRGQCVVITGRSYVKKTTLNPPATTLTNVEGKFTLNDVEGGLSVADGDFNGNLNYIYEHTRETDAELVVHITTDATDFAEGLRAWQKRQYKASAKATMELYNNIYSCALSGPSSSPSGGGKTCPSSPSPIVCGLPPRPKP